MSETPGLNESHAEKDALEVTPEEFFQDKDENVIEKLLEVDNVQTASYMGNLAPKIKDLFDTRLSAKASSLDDVMDKLEKCNTYIAHIESSISEKGDTEDRIAKIVKLFNTQRDKLLTKKAKLEKKIGVTPENESPAKEVPTQEVPEPAETTEDTKATEDPTPVAQSENKGKKPKPAFSNSLADAFNALNTPPKTSSVITQIRADSQAKNAPANKDPESPKDGEKVEKITFSNINDLISFIRDSLPTKSGFNESSETEVLVETEKILKEAYKEARVGGKESVGKFQIAILKLRAELSGLLTSPGLQDTSKKIAESIIADFDDLNGTLNKKLETMQKPEKAPAVNTKENVKTSEDILVFFSKNLKKLNINSKERKDIFTDIAEVIDSEFENVKDLDKKSIEDYRDKISNLKKEIGGIGGTETEKNKQILFTNLVNKLSNTINKIELLLVTPPTDQPEKSKKAPKEIKNIDNILTFLRRDLITIPEDQLDKKAVEISNVFKKEILSLALDNSKANALLVEGKALKIRDMLTAINYDGKKEEFVTKVLSEVKEVIQKLTKEEAAPTPKAATAAGATPEKKPERDISEMIDIGDTESPNPIPAHIKKNTQFNSWIQRMIKRGHKEKYTGPAQTYEAWYETFTELKPSIEMVTKILTEEHISTKTLKGFGEKGDKEFALKKKIENLEYGLLTNPMGQEIVHDIITKYENTKKLEQEIKKLKDEEKRITDAYNGNEPKISPDQVFSIEHKDKADEVKMNEFEGFLRDMSLNYDKYKQPKSKEGTDDELSDVFAKYIHYREKANDYKGKKIGGIGGFLKKLWYPFTSRDLDFDDTTEFAGKIKTLRDAGLVESKNVGKNAALAKVKAVENITRMVKNKMANKKSIEVALSEINDSPDKELFKKVFYGIIKSVGDNERKQSLARSAEAQESIYEDFTTKIKHVEAAKEVAEKETIESIFAEEGGIEEFEAMIKEELVDVKLKAITDSIAKMNATKTYNAKSIEKLFHDFETIDEDDAEETEYKKVTLQLSQLRVRFIGQSGELHLAEESIKDWEEIFKSDETKDEKKIAAEIGLKTFRAARIKPTLSFGDGLELDRFIKYFEDKVASYK